MVFLIRLSQFFVATIWSCDLVYFLYSSFAHFQLEVFVGNSQSAKTCKLSSVKVANECQNTDMINLYSQVLDVCYLKFVFCFITILQIGFWNDGRGVVLSLFGYRLNVSRKLTPKYCLVFLVNNSCEALSVFLLWFF